MVAIAELWYPQHVLHFPDIFGVFLISLDQSLNLFFTNFDLLNKRLDYFLLLIAKLIQYLLVFISQLTNLLLEFLQAARMLVLKLFVLVTKLEVLSSNLLCVSAFLQDLNVEVDKHLLFLSLLQLVP